MGTYDILSKCDSVSHHSSYKIFGHPYVCWDDHLRKLCLEMWATMSGQHITLNIYIYIYIYIYLYIYIYIAHLVSIRLFPLNVIWICLPNSLSVFGIVVYCLKSFGWSLSLSFLPDLYVDRVWCDRILSCRVKSQCKRIISFRSHIESRQGPVERARSVRGLGRMASRVQV